MKDFNHVGMIGRLTRNCERTNFQSGGMLKMDIAVSDDVKKDGQYQSESYFFRVQIYGKVIDSLEQYLTKGRQILVNGKLVQQRWEDRSTGKQKSSVVIVADSIQLLAAPKAQTSEGNPYSRPQQTPPQKPYNPAPRQQYTVKPSEGPELFSDPDVPF